MDLLSCKNVLEIIYYISFIVLTILIVVFTILSYNNTTKKPKIMARINFNIDGKGYIDGYGIPVTIDLLNIGDKHINNVNISFTDDKAEFILQDSIPYIGPHELYKYTIGFIIGNSIHWIKDDKSTPIEECSRPSDYVIDDSDAQIISIIKRDGYINVSKNSETHMGGQQCTTEKES